jgi:alkyl sulfatase BDS1-like metallo-beta-lactamase superfamily hydrolase
MAVDHEPHEGQGDAKDATPHTRDANRAVLDRLPFHNNQAYYEVRRGLLVQVKDLVIDGPDGPAWSLLGYLDQMSSPPPACPDTVNPSLWRMATLNAVAGLFEVVEGIYQVRAFDLSNMTIVESATGVIVIDPLISTECARAALELYRTRRPDRGPVQAVIYTHSHADHFGGARGVLSDADLARGVPVVAAAGFLDRAAAAGVHAGTAIARRAQYAYGQHLPRGPRGQIDGGLGKSPSSGTVSLIAPTLEVSRTSAALTLDGVAFEFHLAPGDAAELAFYLPRFRALCAAESTAHHMHSLQTLRGGPVRDPLAWAKYLGDAVVRFGHRSEVLFAQHHWPVWGTDKVRNFLRKQRDLVRYLNDQTLRLLNKGYTADEIAETFALSPGLDQDWSCRGYHTAVRHNIKAVYERYLGSFDGNPASLHPLPAARSAPRYVEAMGGTAAVLARAAAAFERGDYRWVAELTNQLLLADPGCRDATRLQADAFEQLGYQSEPATWRNAYLSAAHELRTGRPRLPPPTAGRDFVAQLSLERIFDLLAARLDGPRAAARELIMNWRLDTGEHCMVEVSHGALSCALGVQDVRSNVTVALARSALDQILLGETTLGQAITTGRLTVTRGLTEFLWFFGLLDDTDPTFPIATPRHPPLPEMRRSRPPTAPSSSSTTTSADDAILHRTWHLAPPLVPGC